MKIAFVGLPLGALLLQADGHEIVWAGICRTQALGTRRLTRALGKDRIVVRPELERKNVIEDVARRGADLLVSWFWTTRIPGELRRIFPRGAFGVHPSLLPRHRGPDPYFWAIERGDHETGVTAHLIDDAYDTGAILASKKLIIDPAWNSWTLAKKLDRPSLALLREVTRAYRDGSPPPPIAQDESAATEAPLPDDDLLSLRWSTPAEAIVRRVRAASPWPGAFTELGDVMIVVTKARATKSYPRALHPGEAFVRDGVVVVRALDDAVELLAGRLDDDDEASLDAKGIAALLGK